MSFWWPNSPLTQTSVPSSALTCLAALSGMRSVSAAQAVVGAARAPAASRHVRRKRGMGASSAPYATGGGHLGLEVSHLSISTTSWATLSTIYRAFECKRRRRAQTTGDFNLGRPTLNPDRHSLARADIHEASLTIGCALIWRPPPRTTQTPFGWIRSARR